MKNVSILFLSFSFCFTIISCQNRTKEDLDVKAQSKYSFYGDRTNLPNSITDTKWKELPIEWNSLPPNDLERVAVLNGDTLVRLDSRGKADILKFGNTKVNFDSLKNEPRFARFSKLDLAINPSNLPRLFLVNSVLVLECQLPYGWEHPEPVSFYLTTKK